MVNKVGNTVKITFSADKDVKVGSFAKIVSIEEILRPVTCVLEGFKYYLKFENLIRITNNFVYSDIQFISINNESMNEINEKDTQWNPDTAKKDGNRGRIDLFPYVALREAGHVLKFGLKKYSRGNWKLAKTSDGYLRAAIEHIMKHIEAVDSTEEEKKAILELEKREISCYDEDTGRLHLAHALVNVGFALWHSIVKGCISPTKEGDNE